MTSLATIRKQLSAAAKHEPESVQPYALTLDKQLRNFASETSEQMDHERAYRVRVFAVIRGSI